MMQLIATVALYVVKAIFERIADKKLVGKLITDFAVEMRKRMKDSAQSSQYFDEMWEEAKANGWKETK